MLYLLLTAALTTADVTPAQPQPKLTALPQSVADRAILLPDGWRKGIEYQAKASAWTVLGGVTLGVSAASLAATLALNPGKPSAQLIVPSAITMAAGIVELIIGSNYRSTAERLLASPEVPQAFTSETAGASER